MKSKYYVRGVSARLGEGKLVRMRRTTVCKSPHLGVNCVSLDARWAQLLQAGMSFFGRPYSSL